MILKAIQNVNNWVAILLLNCEVYETVAIKCAELRKHKELIK